MSVNVRNFVPAPVEEVGIFGYAIYNYLSDFSAQVSRSYLAEIHI